MAMDSYVTGAVIIGASAVTAVVGLLVVRKTYDVRTLVSAHDISGQYLSIAGTLYAVLLGLIVVDAMGQFSKAVDIVDDEANAIFVFDDLRVQVILTAMVALLISLNIFLILMFGYPFSGELSVSPDSLRATLLSIPLAGSVPATH